MSKILRNPDVTGPEIDGAVCRITGDHDLNLAVKNDYLLQYQNDEMVSVRLLDNDSRQFVVLKSLLEQLR